MAAIKMTWFFKATSQPGPSAFETVRAGGFTESWYIDQPDVQSVGRQATRWARLRAGLLPLSVVLYKCRASLVADPGVTQDYFFDFPGVIQSPEIPQMAALVQVSDPNNRYRKNTYLRGVPDNSVVGGALVAGPGFGTALIAWRRNLVDEGFQFRVIEKGTAAVSILSGVALTRTLVYRGASALVVGTTVQVYRTSSPTGGRLRGWLADITATDPVAKTITLNNWEGPDIRGGKLRQYSRIYVAANTFFTKRVGTRKVGRPFEPYVGRQSRRRRT